MSLYRLYRLNVLTDLSDLKDPSDLNRSSLITIRPPPNLNKMNLDELYKARYVLNSIIRRTDLVQAPRLNPEADIYLKPENLQVTGSFKVRGACYKISQLSKEAKERGVIACSAGNHAQGVALVASHAGVK